MAGLVQHFTLEADSQEQLVLAIKILQRWHKKVTHYVAGVDRDNVPFLSLLWGDHKRGEALPLIAPLDDADAIALQVQSWLKTVEYGRQPDHDGDNSKGFRLLGAKGPAMYPADSWRSCDWDFYSVLTVQPKWIEYGK